MTKMTTMMSFSALYVTLTTRRCDAKSRSLELPETRNWSPWQRSNSPVRCARTSHFHTRVQRCVKNHNTTRQDT